MKKVVFATLLAGMMFLPKILADDIPNEGWTQIDSGWQYIQKGRPMQNQWLLTGNKWYRFNDAGLMQMGWIQEQGQWYYLSKSGAMETGWFTASYNGKNHWFYANQNGEMQTGWIMDCKNRWYSLKEDGTVRSHWYQEQGVWYYLGFDGEMRTGWTITEGSHNRWSYFEPNGAMVSDTTVMGADGTLYLINSDGYMVSNGTGREFYRDGNGDEYCVLEVGEVLTGWYLQSNVTLTSAGYDLLFDWIDHQEPNRDINPDRVVQRLQQFKNRYYFGPDGKRWTNLPETMSITSDIVMKQGKPYIEKFHQKIHMASPFTIVNQHLYYLEHEKTGELKPGYSVLIGSGPEFGVNILVYADNTGRILKMRRLSKDYLKDIHQVPMDGLNDDRILIDYNRDGQEVTVLDKE